MIGSDAWTLRPIKLVVYPVVLFIVCIKLWAWHCNCSERPHRITPPPESTYTPAAEGLPLPGQSFRSH
jgi:hypothetical protein